MQGTRMTEYDMQEVVIKKRLPKAGHLSSEQAFNQAVRAGVQVDTEKKYAAGTNKQHQISKNTAILDQETDTYHHETVTMDVSRAMQQARQAVGMTQKELAAKISEKQQIVNDYEAGRAIPNQQVLGKLERALGVKLRGKNIGQKFGKR